MLMIYVGEDGRCDLLTMVSPAYFFLQNEKSEHVAHYFKIRQQTRDEMLYNCYFCFFIVKLLLRVCIKKNNERKW